MLRQLSERMPTDKKPERERFQGPVKYAEYFFARALITVLQRLPVGLAYRLGRTVGWLAWKLMARRRATVRKNLEIVNAWIKGREACPGASADAVVASDASSRSELAPDRSSEASEIKNDASSCIPRHSSLALPVEAQVREVFQRAGANLFSSFTFNRMSPDQAARHIEIEGVGHLQAALAKGRGVIVLLAHMGPWEALTQLPGLARRKYGIEAPFGAIYRALNNHYLDNWYRRQREARGTRLFLSRYKFYAPVDFLRSGGMLGVISDQRASGGEDVLFFGQKTRGTPLPGLLAKRADCPMLAVAVQTVRPMRWRIRIQPAEQPVEAKRNRQTLANSVARAVESSLLQSIEDGFWFHRRFKDVRSR